MVRLKKWIAITVVMMTVISLLAGCNNNGSTTTTGDLKTLRIGLDSDILKLDPAFAYDFTTNPVVNQITQGLMYYDKDNNLVPLLAKEWKTTDPITYVYSIRDDVTFSDGTPMTMDDVVYSLKRHTDPAVESLLAGRYTSVDTIEATGDWELTVKLKVPDATFIKVFAGTAGHVVKKEYCEAQAKSFGTSEGGLIGTGPFKYKLGSWVTGTSLTLEKNENYWNKDDVAYYDVLDIKVIKEENTRVAAIKNGDVDVLTLPPAGLLDQLYDDPNVTMLEQPSFGLVYMAFNNEKAPFNDPRVHQAVAHGIDFASIHTNLVKKAGYQSTVLPFSSAMFTPEKERWDAYLAAAPKYEYDVEKAKALLAEAGYPEGGLNLSLMTNEDGLRSSICVAIQEQLALIGITVSINKVSGDEHTAYQFGEKLSAEGLREYDILMAGWSGDFPEINEILKPLYSSDQNVNAARYNNPQVDQLILAQSQEADPIKRNDIMFQIMDIITVDMPYLVTFYPLKTYALNKNITGIDAKANWVANVHFQDAKPVEGAAQ
jgi:peptide/nickel transport system substrate-binding protein